MDYANLIPLISQLLALGLRIADMIEQADNISIEDKEALKKAIQEAKTGVTPWEPTKVPPLT